MKIMIVILAILFASCQMQMTSLEDYIHKFDTLDFNEFRGKAIYHRSGGSRIGTSIYLLSSLSIKCPPYDPCPPYAVEVENSTSKILHIENDLVISNCGVDYLSRDSIVKIMTKFLYCKIMFISVDEEYNIYINPYSIDSHLLLKKNPKSNLIIPSYYKEYIKGWYVMKEYE